MVEVSNGAAAVVAVEEARIFVVRQSSNLLAVRDTKCPLGFIDRVTTKYAPNLIAPQLAYKINNDSLRFNQFFAPLFVDGTNLVLAAKLKPEAQLNYIMLAAISGQMHAAYCSKTNPWWVGVRRINYNLLVHVYDKDEKTLMLGEQFTPKDCWWSK
jgi:hypothetical protein